MNPPDLAELERLLERVRDTASPDRELDRDIHVALFGEPVEAAIGDNRTVRFYRTWDGDRTTGLPSPYRFTCTVEDAEKALPGPEWPEWQITRRFCTGYHANVGMGDDGVGFETPALALLDAALRARISTLGGSHGQG